MRALNAQRIEHAFFIDARAGGDCRLNRGLLVGQRQDCDRVTAE